ncbi:hypothetical protein FQN60_015535, partial [Etheostoma spectabile]
MHAAGTQATEAQCTDDEQRMKKAVQETQVGNRSSVTSAWLHVLLVHDRGC